MNLSDFEQLASTRRSVRNFQDAPVEEETLKRLLAVSRWAPSGYNLQPTHFVVVQDREIRQQLCVACMNQRQVREAPATVVFTGDRRAVENNLERMIRMEREAGVMDDDYEKVLRKFVGLAFNHGPAGLGWLWKSALPPLASLRTPIPKMPAVYKSFWLAKQVMLNAMIFMLAAHAAGLATVPMEGFDERRVKKILSIPASHIVPLVIPVGHPVEADLKKTRLPIQEKVHWNGW